MAINSKDVMVEIFNLMEFGSLQQMEEIFPKNEKSSNSLEFFTADSGINRFRSKQGQTLLQHAVISQREDVVKFLIEKGANVNAMDWYGETALVHLIKNNYNFEILTLLLENGANPNWSDEYGETVLYMAVGAERDMDALTLLIKHGASPTLKTTVGDTPLNYAREIGVDLDSAIEDAHLQSVLIKGATAY
jgi:ankyrin repeat protein